MPALQTAAWGKGDHGTNQTFYFGYFEGMSNGYMYKAEKFPDVETSTNKMMADEPDLSIKNLIYADGFWIAIGEHMDENPQGRELVFFDDFDAFDKGIQERVAKQMRPICVATEPYDDGKKTRWGVYFEGKLLGKASTCVCETNEEMLALMDKKIGEQEYSLQCIAFGDDTWFSFFMTDTIQGDANWTMNSKYQGDEGFIGTVKKHMDEDLTMRKCTFGNKVWFGYWEGDVKGGDAFAWTSQPKQTGFFDHVKEQWEADDEDGAGAGGDDDNDDAV